MYESTRPFIPCRLCKAREKAGETIPQPGYYLTTFQGYTVAKECDCHKRWRKENDLARNLEKSGVVADYSFDDYRGTTSLEQLNALKLIASDFDRFSRKKMIYLWGENGTQKTSMVQALGKELIKQGYTVQYTLMNTLINNLVKEFDDPNQDIKDNFIKKCSEVDLLIIDESFDSTKTTVFKSGFQVPYLDAFIRSRFESGKKSILFVSNKLPSEISSQGFSTSLQNLIERNTQQSFLEFKDVYIKNSNTIDKMGLFK